MFQVLPHFEQYPMLSSKQKEFETFASIVRITHEGEHLQADGFEQVVLLAGLLNRGSKKRYLRSEIVVEDKGIVCNIGNSDKCEVPTCTNGITT